MPNTREKLIELLTEVEEYAVDSCIYQHCEDCAARKYGMDCRKYLQAAHLIANGVVISNSETTTKWISVTERLPELHTKVLCCGIKGGRFIAELGTYGHEKHLYWDKKNGQGCPTVTHWMPLPEPPKGE